MLRANDLLYINWVLAGVIVPMPASHHLSDRAYIIDCVKR